MRAWLAHLATRHTLALSTREHISYQGGCHHPEPLREEIQLEQQVIHIQSQEGSPFFRMPFLSPGPLVMKIP